MNSIVYRTFKARRTLRRNLGLALTIFGALLLVAIRFRVRFPGALWIELGGGLACAVIGFLIFAGAYGLPAREVLMLAQDKGAAVTPADLVTEMKLDLESARSILGKMTQQGLLRRADNAEAYLLAGDAPRSVRK